MKWQKPLISNCLLLTNSIQVLSTAFCSVTFLCHRPTSFIVQTEMRSVFVSRLRPIDVEFMKRLGKIVSIVPVIAKADTLTIEERQEFKERVMDHIYTPSTKAVVIFSSPEDFQIVQHEQIFNLWFLTDKARLGGQWDSSLSPERVWWGSRGTHTQQ